MDDQLQVRCREGIKARKYHRDIRRRPGTKATAAYQETQKP